MRLSTVNTRLPTTDFSVAARIDTTDLSGDIGWQWDVSDQWQLLANLGAGFRAPNIFDLGTLGNRPGNRFNVPNTTLESERILQLDVGTRYQRERLQIELFIFALDYDDRITSVSTGATTTDGRDIVQSVNAARAELLGAEAAMIVDVSDSMQLRMQATYTRGEQVVGQQSEAADRIPPLSGRASIRYAKSDSFSLHGWLRFADGQHRLSARDVRDPRINPDGTSGWGILGARADWTVSDRTELSLGVDNLLDRAYRTHGSGLDAPGRNAFATISYRW